MDFNSSLFLSVILKMEMVVNRLATFILQTKFAKSVVSFLPFLPFFFFFFFFFGFVITLCKTTRPSAGKHNIGSRIKLKGLSLGLWFKSFSCSYKGRHAIG